MIERLSPEGLYKLRDAGGRAYPQVIRVSQGTQIYLSGLVAVDADGNLIGENDMAAQATAVYENIGRALAAVGAGPGNAVSYTVFATDLDSYRQHGSPVAAAFFGESRPTSTVVEVIRLADPRYLIDVQVIAVVDRE